MNSPTIAIIGLGYVGLPLAIAFAEKYNVALNKKYAIPYIAYNCTSTYAQYSIRVQNRDSLQKHLKSKGIPTAVYYPMPLHLQECFNYLGYTKGDFPISEKTSQEIMSLPMNPYLSDEEIAYIAGYL